MKTRGANIHCSICSAQPFPDDPAIRESFDLLRADGDWFTRASPPGQKGPRMQRVASVASPTALDMFENMIGEQFATLAEAIDDKNETAWQALETVEEEVARGLEALKKAIVK